MSQYKSLTVTWRIIIKEKDQDTYEKENLNDWLNISELSEEYKTESSIPVAGISAFCLFLLWLTCSIITLKNENKWFNTDAHCYKICCCCLVTQLCPTCCDPTDCSTPGFPVLQHLLETVQTHVHWLQQNDFLQKGRVLLDAEANQDFRK